MQCVYRFIDLEDDIIKYVGIVFGEKRTLYQRTYDHIICDEWCKNSSWKVEYIDVSNRTEADSLESHFISVYNTGEFFNKSKSKWGINSFLDNITFEWKEYCQIFDEKIYVTEDYPIKLVRVGLRATLCDIDEMGVSEEVVYGRCDDDGYTYINDGSIIRSCNIGKVFCSEHDLRGFKDKKHMIITNERARKPKLQNIDMVSYCPYNSDIKSIKSLMLNIIISAKTKDLDMTKKRYESAYRIYKKTIDSVDRLVQIKSCI